MLAPGYDETTKKFNDLNQDKNEPPMPTSWWINMDNVEYHKKYIHNFNTVQNAMNMFNDALTQEQIPKEQFMWPDGIIRNKDVWGIPATLKIQKKWNDDPGSTPLDEYHDYKVYLNNSEPGYKYIIVYRYPNKDMYYIIKDNEQILTNKYGIPVVRNTWTRKVEYHSLQKPDIKVNATGEILTNQEIINSFESKDELRDWAEKNKVNGLPGKMRSTLIPLEELKQILLNLI